MCSGRSTDFRDGTAINCSRPRRVLSSCLVQALYERVGRLVCGESASPLSPKFPFSRSPSTMPLGVAFLAALVAVSGALANSISTTSSSELDACPGYTATNVVTSGPNLTASLVLTDDACDVYGPDIETLNLQVTYETGASKHDL